MTLTVDEKLEKLNNILDEYELLNGLPRFQSRELSDEINNYLTMSIDQLEKLHPEDCANISVRLAQEAFHLQRSYNREKAQVISMETALDRRVAQYRTNYSQFIKYPLLVASVINEDEYAKKLQEVIIKATQRMDRLNFLSDRINNISHKFLSIQQAKLASLKSTGG